MGMNCYFPGVDAALMSLLVYTVRGGEYPVLVNEHGSAPVSKEAQ